MPDDASARRPIASILAFDFGLRRIGVAVGQTVTGSASPLGIVRNTPHGPDHRRIAELVAEWRPDCMVVGIPLDADGRSGALGDAIGGFIDELSAYGLPVASVDESHSSREALATLKAARRRGSRGRVKKADVDAAAAVRIAERYIATLDSPG